MKKGIIVSLLLSLIFVQSAYCYKLTIINDTKSNKTVTVVSNDLQEEVKYPPVKIKEGRSVEFRGGWENNCVEQIIVKGKGAVQTINGVGDVRILCNDHTVNMSDFNYLKKKKLIQGLIFHKR